MNKFDKVNSKTLWERWQFNASNFPDNDAIVHWIGGEEPYRWTYKNLIETAKKFSVIVRESGIKPGEVCALIIRHHHLFYPLYMGILRIGALPAVLAYPNPRIHPDKFRQGVEGMSQRSGLDWIFTEHDLDPIIRPLIEKKNSTIKSIVFPLEWDLEKNYNKNSDDHIEQDNLLIKETDPALLQHSSGTTGLQKPVVLSHKAILQHVKNCATALELASTDKVISWLPLYHDMGLIASFHLPLAYGITGVHISPFEWVLAPVLMLEAITKEKGTLSWIPNFAFNILADKIDDEELEEISLESLRLLINCSEPVRHDSIVKFTNKFINYNFNPQATGACYGMAETTFAVTQTTPGEKIKTFDADRTALSKGIVRAADKSSVIRVCVSSGKLIDGCDIRIVDENRKDLPPGFVGEFAVKSVSMFDGYRNYPEKTAEVVEDGWYYSGDYGFISENECFAIGRKKDIIIVAGKNIYPEDIEDAVGKVENVIPGRVVAFGEEDLELGTEQISIIAETKFENETDKNKLRLEIMKAGMGIDMNIHKVYLVPPRWLIKSSAGKPSRNANKERILKKEDPQVWSR
ncbi:MAG: hypothetical protein A2V66_12845 [Ignavibacteria bacterium RBG_13_36_8]|nr:MAG: hypothetical protein A2V66_12845 [Ignavibacteria bacterium RBG_13_36_8]